MNEDRIAGTTRNLAGKAQEGLGRVTGDPKSQAEGLVEQAAGAAQDLYGQAKDAAADAAAVVRQGAADTDDYVRQIIEKRPYTTAIIALCIGWVIGRMGRQD
ncbi:MAG TPA: CsbD family protein [Bradyrhizobium sp.]|uniref:CsbD family protein n=1 Tax=Bradyrhizobium sp. TaxID=376 RepID=UPI002CEBBA71|nr:CsbD family protein [Bradyrhizobium sp.]HLZ01701.1 CsbD family protein [Bradyrhizobium sp.]